MAPLLARLILCGRLAEAARRRRRPTQLAQLARGTAPSAAPPRSARGAREQEVPEEGAPSGRLRVDDRRAAGSAVGGREAPRAAERVHELGADRASDDDGAANDDGGVAAAGGRGAAVGRRRADRRRGGAPRRLAAASRARGARARAVWRSWRAPAPPAVADPSEAEPGVDAEGVDGAHPFATRRSARAACASARGVGRPAASQLARSSWYDVLKARMAVGAAVRGARTAARSWSTQAASQSSVAGAA